MQSLEKDRLPRLRTIGTLLGEPDLLTIFKTTTSSSFLSTKKLYEKQQNFVFGLYFPTTAHLSSYINNRIQTDMKNSKHQITYKIKLYVYDAFKKIDFQIQINIPGSLELRAFNLNGQPINITNQDYGCAYYSSVLRSFYPHFYHANTSINGQIQKYQIMESFIRNFVPYAAKNQLPNIDELYDIQNVAIELLANYLKKNSLWNLCNVLLFELYKVNNKRGFIFSLELKQAKEQYKQIILQCAEELLKFQKQTDQNRQIAQFQVRALSKLKKKRQAKLVGEKLIRQGLDHLQSWEQLLKISFQIDNDRNFFKMLNTAVSLTGEELTLSERIQNAVFPKKLKLFDEEQQKNNKGNQISCYPQYMFKFDQKYLQGQTKMKGLQDLLEKTQKQKPTLQILNRLDQSLKQQSFFHKFITLYEKHKGWNNLLDQRAQCFWLQNDYAVYENSIRKKQSEMSYRFINESFGSISESSIKNIGSKNKIQQNIRQFDQQQEDQNPSASMNESFEGEFSETESETEKQLGIVAPCSKRVATKRVFRQAPSISKIQISKILCNFNLEKIFLMTYNNLRLQGDTEKWASKLNIESMGLSKQKRQLISLVFLKKGFFHKNMLRYRKSEQSFKLARKCSNSTPVSLISCYCLAKLYLEHNNIKGVEYYTVEIVRILFSLGIQNYEVVPLWAKQIIPYIIKNYGKVITKRLQGPLKQIVQLWLQIDHK